MISAAEKPRQGCGTGRKEEEGARFSRKREEARTGATTEIEA